MASKVITKLGSVKQTGGLRYMSQQRKSFLGGFMDNLKEEFNKNKEMKETIKKFREEAKKIEESDALKEARKKYKLIEDEKEKSSKVFKEKLEEFTGKVKESEITKKAFETSGKVFTKAKEAAQDISNTETMKKVTENVKSIKKDIDESTLISSVKLYRPPKELRKRCELNPAEQKVYESNTEATGVVMHKDSKWFQTWSNFKENNAYVNKLFDLKTKYDESDNSIVRATRVVSEKFYNVFGGMFKSNEMSEVLTEIVKMDPNFDVTEFTKFVQNEIIPNILESISRQDLDILRDWCTDTAFTILSHPITTSKQLNLKYFTKVLDINNVDLAAGKMMDQGPVLIVTFTAQQVIYVTDLKGAVIEGDKNKLKHVSYVWALCRDQTIIDPKSAWRLMECSAHQSDLFV